MGFFYFREMLTSLSLHTIKGIPEKGIKFHQRKKLLNISLHSEAVCLYNYHSDVKVLSVCFGGFLGSMCEGTSAPPCELNVNKPTS